MKQFKCPDCGAIMSESCPDKCPKCGCPANLFITTEIPENRIENMSCESGTTSSSLSALSTLSKEGHRKIYYSDDCCIIGDKIWELSGYPTSSFMTLGMSPSAVKLIIPVNQIVSVGIQKRYPWWWALLIIGIFTAIIVIGIALIIISLRIKNKTDLMIHTPNTFVNYSFKHFKNELEAQKYLMPMRQCLLDYNK